MFTTIFGTEVKIDKIGRHGYAAMKFPHGYKIAVYNIKNRFLMGFLENKKGTCHVEYKTEKAAERRIDTLIERGF